MANPFGPSFMIVAESNGKVIGLRAFMRWRFLAGNRTLSAVQAVDTATHPDFQGMGVFSTLTRTALDELRDEIDLVYNTPNEKSLPGYLKMGWRPVGTLPVSVRIRRPVRFARAVIADGDGRTDRPTPSGDAESAGDALAARAEVSGLLADLDEEEHAITTARSVEYLRWRYGDVPNLDYYALREHLDRRLQGLAIFRIRPRRGLWETALVELLVRGRDRATARRLVRRVLACANTDHASCHFRQGSWQAGVVLRTGFLHYRTGVSLVVNLRRADIQPDPGLPGSWALCLGDLEVF
jgi:GNAT superfamily N-acetyltransferase